MPTSPIAANLTEDEARRLTQRIGLLLDSASSTLDRLATAIREARDRRADLALGYSSWAEYAGNEFGPHTSGLSAAIRRELVANLSVEVDGSPALSTRQIAPAVGVTHPTVISDQRKVVSDLPPNAEPDGSPALSARTYDCEAHDFHIVDHSDDVDGFYEDVAEHEALHEGDTTANPETGEVIEPAKIKGLDGKTYQRPVEPTKPRRKPITDTARDAGWGLRKAVERLERIVEDDRFSANKEQVAQLLLSHLSEAVKVCQDLVDHLNPEGK